MVECRHHRAQVVLRGALDAGFTLIDPSLCPCCCPPGLWRRAGMQQEQDPGELNWIDTMQVEDSSPEMLGTRKSSDF